MTVQALIEKYQSYLDFEKDEVIENRPVTLRLLIQDVALAQALADYYRMSRAGFLQDAISQLLEDLFFALPGDVRRVVADSAQDIYQRERGDGFLSKWFVNRDWSPSAEKEQPK